MAKSEFCFYFVFSFLFSIELILWMLVLFANVSGLSGWVEVGGVVCFFHEDFITITALVAADVDAL